MSRSMGIIAQIADIRQF